jgi:signal transduction histidine kinase
VNPAARDAGRLAIRNARALIEANAQEATDLIGELTLLLDRIGNESTYIAAARMVTRRIADRVGQLVTLERLERGGSMRPDMWSPIALLEELEHEAIALAGNRMDISVRTPELVPQYWFFDRELAGMVLSNALHSALTHATRCVVLELHLRDGQLGFCIADDGGAFPEELVASTAQTFERGEINGNALGIHFARLVAATHTYAGRHGWVELSNHSNGPGTRFALWLP